MAIVIVNDVLVINDIPWQEFAACKGADYDAFFTEPGDWAQEAKNICKSCPVRKICLDYAIDNNEIYGIWGGMSRRERKREKLRRLNTLAS